MSSFPCLICGSEESDHKILDSGGDNENGGDSFLISRQLNAVFILKYLLEVPTTKLQCYLETLEGNPENWISLCEKCTQITGEARSLHFQILEISSKLKSIQKEILKTVKRPVNIIKSKLTTSPKLTVWKETRSFVQNHNYDSHRVTTTGTDVTKHQCPTCFTQFHLQLPPQSQQVNEEEEDSSKFQQCLYCTSQFPSITSLLKHIQTIHEMQRLPCLHPGCDVTLKNMRNFWKHRQRHKRKEEATSPTETFIKASSEDDHCEIEDGINDNHSDNHDDHIQSQITIKNEDPIRIPAKVEHFEDAEADEESVSLENSEDEDDDSADLQDALGNYSDKDNDWLPSGEDQEEPEINFEMNCKPEDDDPSNVTEDTAYFSKIIKGGTRTSQQCPQCPQKFPSISSTLRHLSTTHHVKKLPCLHPGCTSTLSTIKAYFKHRKLHLYPKTKKEKDPQKVIEEGPCLCDLCGASFKKKQYLNRHKIVVHLKRWKCTEKKVTCHLCGLSYKSGYLKKHMLHMHKGQGEGHLLQCGVVGCKRVFIKQEGLDNHMIKKHGNGVKQFSCGYCGKGFCFKRKLDQHELSHRNQQLGIRPFVCDICGKGFGIPQNLANHLNYTHKLAKRFQRKTD